MKVSRIRLLGASLAGIVGVGLYSMPAHATTSTASSTILVNAAVVPPVHVKAHGLTLAGDPWGVRLKTYGLSDGYVVDNKFLPGQTTGWHSHPGPSLIFVVAGEVTNYESSTKHCAGKTYSAGSSFIDEGGTDIHELVNNGSLPAETIAVQLIPSGQPRRIDEDEPANCHV